MHTSLRSGLVAKGLICVALAIGLPVLSAAAEDQVTLQVANGGPLGVGKLTVKFAETAPQPLRLRESLWVSDTQNRVLYPVYSAQETRLRNGAGDFELESVTAYFLFQGAGPLDVSFKEERTYAATGDPVADPALYRNLLQEWWRQYSALTTRLVREHKSPADVENYLAGMLAKRLKLPPLTIDRKLSEIDGVDMFLGLLLGAESVRLAMQLESFLEHTNAEEKANQPLPNGTGPRALPIPALPADVAVEPLAQHVPAECFYLRCRSLANLNWLQSLVNAWGGDLRRMVAVRGLDYSLREHLERQLALRETALSTLLGDAVIADLALIGSDTFFREGAAVGVLFQAKNNALLSAAIGAQRAEALQQNPGVTETKVQIGSRAVSFLSNPENSVRSFYVVDGDFHLVTTSQTLARRFVEAGKGEGSLGNLQEFRYARSQMPLTRQDTAFLYLSDPFFRQLVSPHYRVEMTRRKQAEAELELVQLAQLAAGAEKLPGATLDELRAAALLPERFGTRPDGSRAVLRADGKIIDSLRGARRSFLPIPDVEIQGLTPAEVNSYRDFVRKYRAQWRRMDPVRLGIQRAVEGKQDHRRERVVLDLHIAPYANNAYGFVAGFLAPPSKQRLIPLSGQLLEMEAKFAGQSGDDPKRIGIRGFAGWSDFEPEFAISQGKVVLREQMLEPPAYLGFTPFNPFGLNRAEDDSKRDPDGYFESDKTFFGRWSRRFGDFIVNSSKKEVLEVVTPQLRFEDAPRPAQLRLRVADLSQSKAAPVLQAYAYTRDRETSAGNVNFLHSVMQQLRVDGEQSREAAESLLAARLTCPLGGKYQFRETQTGSRRWRTDASAKENLIEENAVPAGYRSALLDFFRGLDLEFNIDRTSLSTRIELELRPRE